MSWICGILDFCRIWAQAVGGVFLKVPQGLLALLPKATQLHTLEILYHILSGYRGDKREKILKFLQILRTIDQEYRNMLYFKDYASWAATGVGICGKAKRNYAEATRLRPAGYAAVASRHSSPCFRTGHPGEGE